MFLIDTMHSVPLLATYSQLLPEYRVILFLGTLLYDVTTTSCHIAVSEALCLEPCQPSRQISNAFQTSTPSQAIFVLSMAPLVSELCVSRCSTTFIMMFKPTCMV